MWVVADLLLAFSLTRWMCCPKQHAKIKLGGIEGTFLV